MTKYGLFLCIVAVLPEMAFSEVLLGQKFILADSCKIRTLPSKVDNRGKYLRTPFEHQGHPCGIASGISYVFTYEINLLRDLPSNSDENRYPYIYGYDFLNNGSGNAMVSNFIDGYELARTNGIPNVVSMGGFTNGYPTKWLSGYEKYYQAMHNRLLNYYYFDLKTIDGFMGLKNWIYDHANGSKRGGLGNFNVESMGVRTVAGTGAAANKTVITSFGTGAYDHSLTVIGYDDSIGYDFNKDGKLTNDIDLTSDGKIDVADMEKGAFLIMNTHIVWDDGFAYVPYRLFALNYSKGGIGRDNKVYCMTVNKNIEPQYTLKVKVTSTSRNKIKIYAGIASSENVSLPIKFKEFASAFKYAGGSFPMEGDNMSSTIEIGLDVSELVDSIAGNSRAFFLCIDTKSGFSGTVNKLSLMDYTGSSVKEYVYKEENVPIASNMRLGPLSPSIGITNKFIQLNKSKIQIQKIGSNMYLALPDLAGGKVFVSIFSLQGRLVAQLAQNISNASLLDISSIAPPDGFYYIKAVITDKRGYSQTSIINSIVIR
jgi:hypothetical protein